MTVAKYTLVYVALLVLTGLTFGLSFAPVGVLEWPIALGIAATKAALVAIFFMHLSEASAAHRFTVIVAVLLLATLILLAVGDVLTRA